MEATDAIIIDNFTSSSTLVSVSALRADEETAKVVDAVLEEDSDPVLETVADREEPPVL